MQNISTSYASFYSGSLKDIVRQGWKFLRHVHRTGKSNELISFIVWEILYRIKYYNRARTLKLTDSIPLSINSDGTLSDSNTKTTNQLITIRAEKISVNWKYHFQDNQQTIWGCEYYNDSVLLRCCSCEGSTGAVCMFSARIRSLYATDDAVFVCAGGTLYRSEKRDIQFEPVLQLTTPESYFLFNNGFSELPNGTLLLGEYASIWEQNKWVNLAHLYVSHSKGVTWKTTDFLKRQGVNKHVHLVKFSPLLNQVFLTDGDNKKQIWRNETLEEYTHQAGLTKHGWQLVNRFHWQMGGYTSMLDHGSGLVFGTDYLGGTNFMVHTTDGRRFRREVIPNPYRRSPIINMVARRKGNNTELWALLHNSAVPGKSCLLMYSTDHGLTWNRFIEYNGQQHEIQLVSSGKGAVNELCFCIRQWHNGHEVSQTYRVTT